MADRKGVRTVIFHCYERGFTVTQTVKEIRSKDLRYQASTSTVSRWFEKFRLGDHSLEDKPRSGRRPTHSTMLMAKELEQNPYLHSRGLAAEAGCSPLTALRNLHKMSLRPKKPSVIPHILSASDKTRRISVCRELLRKHRKGSFFQRVITCDEKWCFFNNFDQSVRWVKTNERPDPVQRKDIHGKKRMLTVFWSTEGVVSWDLVPQGMAIDADYVCKKLEEMVVGAESMGRKRDEILLRWNNCRPHFAKKTQEKLKQLQLEFLSHSAYSPEISLSDYHLFRSLQHWRRGKQLKTEDDLKHELTAFFESKQPSFYNYGIGSLARRWRNVIDNDGSYFE